MKRSIILAAILLLAVTCGAFAQNALTPDQLKDMKVNLKRFAISNLSYNGNVLLAHEKTADPALKKAGYVYILHVFNLSRGSFSEHHSINLPLTALDQIALNYKGDKALVVGESGSKFILVDITSGTAEVFFASKPGVPGFRCSEGLVFYYEGNFYALGYLYDQDKFMTQQGLVKIAPGADPVFQPVLDTLKLKELLKGELRHSLYLSPQLAFFGIEQEDKNLDIVAVKEDKVIKIDDGRALGGFAAGGGRLLYSLQRAWNNYVLKLWDVNENKFWVLAQNQPYTYLYLSKDGRIAVAALLDFKAQTMSYFYAREDEGFILKPLPGLQKVKLGTFRLSGDGLIYAFLSQDGLEFGRMP